MKHTYILKRRNKNISKFFELFENEHIIKLKDIKRAVSSSSFYKCVLKEVFELNKAVKRINPELEFIRPAFKQETEKGQVFQALELQNEFQVSHDESFIYIEFEL